MRILVDAIASLFVATSPKRKLTHVELKRCPWQLIHYGGRALVFLSGETSAPRQVVQRLGIDWWIELLEPLKHIDVDVAKVLSSLYMGRNLQSYLMRRFAPSLSVSGTLWRVLIAAKSHNNFPVEYRSVVTLLV